MISALVHPVLGGHNSDDVAITEAAAELIP